MGILGNGTPKSSSLDVLTKEQLSTTAELASAMVRAVDYSLAEMDRHARPLFAPVSVGTLEQVAARQADAALSAVLEQPVPASAEVRAMEGAVSAPAPVTPTDQEAINDLNIQEIRSRIADMPVQENRYA